MKIAFFQEGGSPKPYMIGREHPNMRTDLAWACSLNAHVFHPPWENHRSLYGYYDIGIVIMPKKNPSGFKISEIKNFCKITIVMQEGPFWYFQDYSMNDQFHYLENLKEADAIFAHNESDIKYFKGILPDKNVINLPSLMIEDSIGELSPENERTGVMLGGNCSSWYGGIDSFSIASQFSGELYAPTMGLGNRFKNDERKIKNLTHIDYSNWSDWMFELSKRKYAIHLMRTFAAGTFSLNCSYLGLPCIAYSYLDTQRKLHPSLTIEDGDLNKARKLMQKLFSDSDFYSHCSKETKQLYKRKYSEEIFLKRFYEKFRDSYSN